MCERLSCCCRAARGRRGGRGAVAALPKRWLRPGCEPRGPSAARDCKAFSQPARSPHAARRQYTVRTVAAPCGDGRRGRRTVRGAVVTEMGCAPSSRSAAYVETVPAAVSDSFCDRKAGTYLAPLHQREASLDAQIDAALAEDRLLASIDEMERRLKKVEPEAVRDQVHPSPGR